MVEKIKRLFSGIYIAFILLFLYAPIGVLVVLSFNSSKARTVWETFTFQWYGTLFSSHGIMEALKTTLLLAFLASFLSTLIGVTGALGIQAMKKRNYKIVMFLTNIPMLNADIVTGIALMLWFVHFIPLGFVSMLIAHITICVPYVILNVMPRIRQMNVSVYEAARDLGATAPYAFFKVLLPQLWGGIISGFFMAFVMSMDDFVVTYFTKGAGINTLSTMIYGEIRKGIKPEMYALSTLIFLFVFVILLMVNYLPEKKADLQKKKQEKISN